MSMSLAVSQIIHYSTRLIAVQPCIDSQGEGCRTFGHFIIRIPHVNENPKYTMSAQSNLETMAKENYLRHHGRLKREAKQSLL